MISLCFVCTANICRSPTAEGLMRSLVDEAGLAARIRVDSAGTVGWRPGARPDPRSRATAHSHGVSLDGVSRPLVPEDLETFDYVLVMDRGHVEEVRAMAWEAEQEQKIHLLRAFDPAAPECAEVPDPYSGGERGFEQVFEMCRAACVGLLEHLRQRHDLAPYDDYRS